MKAIILDTETTGLKKPEYIEVAYLEVDDLNLNVKNQFYQQYKPNKEIDYGAMAVHHIVPSDLADCSPTGTFKFPKGVDYLIGHNIDFDWEVIGKPDVKRIDTLALSRYLIPECDSHTQSALLYFFELSRAKEKLVDAHNALADTKICLAIFRYLLQLICAKEIISPKDLSFDSVYELSEKARIPTKMPFGKYKGKLIKDVPLSYKVWLVQQRNVDEYLAKALVG